jgi:hypothetical protein
MFTGGGAPVVIAQSGQISIIVLKIKTESKSLPPTPQ